MNRQLKNKEISDIDNNNIDFYLPKLDGNLNV